MGKMVVGGKRKEAKKKEMLLASRGTNQIGFSISVIDNIEENKWLPVFHIRQNHLVGSTSKKENKLAIPNRISSFFPFSI